MRYVILPLPKDLIQNKSNMDITLYESEKPNFDHTSWSSAFTSKQDILNDLDLLRRRCGDLIRRDTVKALAREALTLNWEDIRRFFLALMIWGFPYGQGGKPRTQSILDSSSTQTTMVQTICLIRDKKIEEAYKTIKMTNFKSASFTKFLYFVGWAYGIEPVPLILDSQVAKYLEFIDDIENTSLLDTFGDWERNVKGEIKPKENSEKYINYINSVNSWAGQLKCQPDAIECYMYLHRGNLNNVANIGTSIVGSPTPVIKQMGVVPTLAISSSPATQQAIPISSSTVDGRLGLSDRNNGKKTWEISIPKSELVKVIGYPITYKGKGQKDPGIPCTLIDSGNPKNTTEASFHGYSDHICIGSANRYYGSEKYTTKYQNFLKSKFNIVIGTTTQSRNLKMDFCKNNGIFVC